MSSKIEITKFSKKYLQHIVKLENMVISKRVNLVVGKNGSGKSTLLKAIANLIHYNGEINMNGKVCFMSEEFKYPKDIKLSLFLTLLNNISNNKSSENSLNSLLCSFKLNSKLDEKIDSLSKGMKAKVNIVQCLLEKADIYLLDEPMSGLDKEGILRLIEFIEKSNKQFIISTHLDNNLLNISNEVFYL